MAQYKVTLTSDERNRLDDICKTGKDPAKQGIYARCLLLLDSGGLNPTPRKEKEVAELMGVVPKTLQHPKKRMVEEGLEAALGCKAYTVPSHRIKYDGQFEAQVVALACSDAPDGHARWTIRLLGDKVVELEIAPSVTTTTIFNTLKERTAAGGLREVPPAAAVRRHKVAAGILPPRHTAGQRLLRGQRHLRPP